jgi:hypothetical protein
MLNRYLARDLKPSAAIMRTCLRAIGARQHSRPMQTVQLHGYLSESSWTLRGAKQVKYVEHSRLDAGEPWQPRIQLSSTCFEFPRADIYMHSIKYA